MPPEASSLLPAGPRESGLAGAPILDLGTNTGALSTKWVGGASFWGEGDRDSVSCCCCCCCCCCCITDAGGTSEPNVKVAGIWDAGCARTLESGPPAERRNAGTAEGSDDETGGDRGEKGSSLDSCWDTRDGLKTPRPLLLANESDALEPFIMVGEPGPAKVALGEPTNEQSGGEEGAP